MNLSQIKTYVRNSLELITEPALKVIPVLKVPKSLAWLHRLNVPSNIQGNPTEAPTGGSNINIILHLTKLTTNLSGAWAECGVYKGGTLITTALWMKSTGVQKKIWGFDSFEGLPEKSSIDENHSTEKAWGHHSGGYKGVSYTHLLQKLSRLGLSNDVELVPGFFENSLPKAAGEKFSFVHLDCDLYNSYKTCLEFFYERMVQGGVILFDEYNDPPWPGCNKAIDEFFANKIEKLQKIVRDNQIKYYIVKN